MFPSAKELEALGAGSMSTEAIASLVMAALLKGKGKKGFGKGKGKGKGGKRDKDPDRERIVQPPAGIRHDTGEKSERKDGDIDMTGRPGPHGEDPSEGNWVFEAKGKGLAKRWKWKKIDPVRDAERAAKRARMEAEEALKAAETAA
eukprot:TRINITY_DN3309_c0_g1_i2.p1 TRINITY_DN3309_c0_g1~~TRINITY_DN3309_c0_g1_i2.p1  ORF type:complete len:146 (-),score=40.75 TRINITY_DN3309_c0_g1_i2:68-505(-)